MNWCYKVLNKIVGISENDLDKFFMEYGYNFESANRILELVTGYNDFDEYLEEHKINLDYSGALEY